MEYMNLKKRQDFCGNSARRERRKGYVPGVIYGKLQQNILFEISELELKREITNFGEHGIVDFSIDGTTGSGLLKSIQRDPVTHKIIHIDIEKIDDGQKVEADVPIVFIGEELLNGKGQVLQKEKDHVRISCRSDNLPKSIKMDVRKGSANKVYRFSDLEVGSEISIIDDLNKVLASISNEKRIISDEMEAK